MNLHDYFSDEDLNLYESEGYSIFTTDQEEISFQKVDDSEIFFFFYLAWEFVLIKSITSNPHKKLVNFIKNENIKEYNELTTKEIKKSFNIANNSIHF